MRSKVEFKTMKFSWLVTLTIPVTVTEVLKLQSISSEYPSWASRKPSWPSTCKSGGAAVKFLSSTLKVSSDGMSVGLLKLWNPISLIVEFLT